MGGKKKPQRVQHYDGGVPPWAREVRRQVYRDLVDECYPVALIDLLVLDIVVLADKFGWTDGLIIPFCNEIILNLKALQAGEINLYELQDEIAKDYGIILNYDPDTKQIVFETPNEERA